MQFYYIPSVFTRKIGQNRGKPRLWIEGKHLTAAGLHHGTRWDLVTTGSRRVAGKPDRPILDIVGASLGHVDSSSSVAITYEPGAGRMVFYCAQERTGQDA